MLLAGLGGSKQYIRTAVEGDPTPTFHPKFKIGTSLHQSGSSGSLHLNKPSVIGTWPLAEKPLLYLVRLLAILISNLC